MTKLKAPLMSMKASQALGKKIILVERYGKTYAKKYVKPYDPQTQAQLEHRWDYNDCSIMWHHLPQTEKDAYATAARPHRLTGFNLFMSEHLKPPLDTYFMSYFDKRFDPKLHDLSQYKRHGTIYGALYHDNFFGPGAIVFDGIDDYVSVPLPLETFKEFTFIFWAKIPPFTGSPRYMVEYTAVAPTVGFLVACNPPANSLFYKIGNDIGGTAQMFPGFWANNWQMHGCRYTGSSFDMFRNTIFPQSRPFTGTVTPAANMRLGKRHDDSGPADHTQGITAFFEFALSNQDIIDFYNATKGVYGV